MHLNEHIETKAALGSEVSIVLVGDIESSHRAELFAKLWHRVYSFERRFSRFLPGSELSAFNRSAGLKTPISPEMHAILTCAQRLSTMTVGLYNPFILPALQRTGYLNSAAPGYESDIVDDYRDRRVVAPSALEIGDDWARIPFNTAIDLGGSGKGYLADVLRHDITQAGIENYLINLGGDMAIAGTAHDGKPWRIAVTSATKPNANHDIEIICPTTPSAIATSGTFLRPGQTGPDWHHLIDPISALPATTDVRLATICAETTLMADVLASCAVILGSAAAQDFITRRGATFFLLQCEADQTSFDVASPSHNPKLLVGARGGRSRD
jgi:thiamine biosynthesis lipoprotein